jgi:hypothetical protein
VNEDDDGFVAFDDVVSTDENDDGFVAFEPSQQKKTYPEEEYKSDEDIERDIERAQAQYTSRALEAVFGLPGDLINFAGNLFGYDINAPGSQKLREVSEDISGGYTSPQSDLEEKVGEAVQDISLFALPGAKHYSIARNIGIPIVANLAKEGIKYAGLNDKQQSYGKIGTMVLLDLMNRRRALGSAKDYASQLFVQAEEAVPKGISIKATNLNKNLDALEASLKKGGSRPDTADALTKIKEIKGEINPKGFIDLKNLLAYRPSINQWIDKYKGFDIEVPPKIRRQITNNLNQVKKEVIKAGEEYGEKFNPEFLKLSRSANEAYAAVEQSNKIKNSIEKIAGSKIKSNALKGLIYGSPAAGAAAGLTVGYAGLAAGGAIGAAVALGYKTLKTILRSRSPVLRKHYFSLIEGAAKGNAPQVIKNVEFLEKHLPVIEKQLEKEEFEKESMEREQAISLE